MYPVKCKNCYSHPVVPLNVVNSSSASCNTSEKALPWCNQPPSTLSLWERSDSALVPQLPVTPRCLVPVYHPLPGTEESKLDPVPRHGLRSWAEGKNHFPHPAGCPLANPALDVIILCCKGATQACGHLIARQDLWVYSAGPSLCCCVGLFYPRYWALHLSTLTFTRFLLTHLCSLFLWKTSLFSSASTTPQVGDPLQAWEDSLSHCLRTGWA